MKPTEIGIDGFLRHIYQETTFITEYLTTITYEEFSQNQVCKYALTRSLEIIGEAYRFLIFSRERFLKNIEGML